MAALSKHFFSQDGLHELKKLAEGFEEKMYTAATSEVPPKQIFFISYVFITCIHCWHDLLMYTILLFCILAHSIKDLRVDLYLLIFIACVIVIVWLCAANISEVGDYSSWLLEEWAATWVETTHCQQDVRVFSKRKTLLLEHVWILQNFGTVLAVWFFALWILHL